MHVLAPCFFSQCMHTVVEIRGLRPFADNTKGVVIYYREGGREIRAGG